MESNKLEIHDEDKSTDGGPPGWLAFTIVFLLFFVVAAIVLFMLSYT